MSIRSWLRAWARWTGGVDADPGARRPALDTGGWQTSSGPLPGPLAREVKETVLPPQVAEALDAYRRSVKALTRQAGAGARVRELQAAQETLNQIPVPADLSDALAILRVLFDSCTDVVFRTVPVGGERQAVALYVDGMVQVERLEQSVLLPLTQLHSTVPMPLTSDALIPWLQTAATAIAATAPLRTVGEVVQTVLAGNGVLVVDGVGCGVKMAIPGWEQRAVEEPMSEPVIRGPREGFTETLRTSTTLLRRRLKTPNLKIEQITLGRRTRTAVVVAYLQDVASPEVVGEVKARLERIDVDGILDTGMLEELIEDQPGSIFPQVLNTERPDTVVGSLLEGQVAILADGSPFALLAPVTLWKFVQASEDYYERFWLGTFLRWLRYFFLVIALTAPSFYIAVATFHQEMLPTALLLSIAAAREGIPFPALVEAFLMELFFEALREAGVRLPRPVGQAVSIVGALVIGQAAVQAGLASAPVVIVVASTGIASFTIPRFSFGIAIRLLRFPIMLMAGFLGLFGIMVSVIAILVHLCALRSFGVPYLQPVAPFSWAGMKDLFVRAPRWLLDTRPPAVGVLDERRQAKWLKPGPGGDR
jgi:hypothetical protein